MPFLRFRIHPSASMVTARAVPCRSDAFEASGDVVHAATRSGLVVGPGITVRGGAEYSGHGMPIVAVFGRVCRGPVRPRGEARDGRRNPPFVYMRIFTTLKVSDTRDWDRDQPRGDGFFRDLPRVASTAR